MRLLIIFLIFSTSVFSQKAGPVSTFDQGTLMNGEKKLQRIVSQYFMDSVESNRFKGARMYVKELVDNLKTPNSFNYPFDSLKFMAKAYPEDSSFRILTFSIRLDDYTYRHYGALQFNSKELKLIPFNDFSDTFLMTPQTTLTNKNWYGMMYYKIITKQVNGRTIYFLVGYDQYDLLSDKKLIEPMWITGNSVQFGMPIFEKTTKTNTGVKTETYSRYLLEYRSNARVGINYDKDKDMIIFDHLSPLESDKGEVGFMLVPDGTLEGLEWKNNKWVWKDYVQMSKEETNGPIKPAPLGKQKLIEE